MVEKITIVVILFFITSSFSKNKINNTRNKSIQINEVSFSNKGATYIFSFPKTLNSKSAKTIDLIVPTSKFSYTIKNMNSKYNTILSKKNTQVKYSGIVRGYHIVSVYLVPQKGNNGNFISQKIDFKFSKSAIKYQKELNLDDDFLKDFVSNYQSGKYFKLQQNKFKIKTNPLNRKCRNFPIYKLYVSEDGIYKLDHYELKKNGIDLKNLNIDPRTLKIFNEGEEIPIFVSGEADHGFDNYDYIEFYGTKNLYRYRNKHPDRYFDTENESNIYFLTWGDGFGKRLAEEDGSIKEADPAKYFSPNYYRTTLHFEEDLVRNQLRYFPEIENPDLWFYTAIDGGMNKNLSFDLNSVKTDSIKIKYSVITALSSPSQFKNYNLNFFVNSKNLPSAHWSGPYPFVDSATVFSTSFHDGQNNLNISNINSLDTRVCFNWFEITYGRYFKGENDYIKFNEGGKLLNNTYYSPKDKLYDFNISDFETDNVSIYKLGVSKIVTSVIKSTENSAGKLRYNIHFQDYISSHSNYIILKNSLKKVPDKIEEKKEFENSLLSTDNHAKFLIIAHNDFMENEDLLNYITYKENQFGVGNIKLVDIEQILDTFSNGEYSGDGLYQFFQYTIDNWSEVPQFVMLVGTATYDHKKFPDLDYIPIKTFQHYRYGAVASDYAFSVEPNGMMPQFYIGRIPCATNSQLSNYLKKITIYENAPTENIVYQKRLRTLSIVTDSLIYNKLETVLKNSFPKTGFLDRLLLWETDEPYQGGTATLLEKMDMGLGTLNYFGHGSGEIWANSRLLLPDDVDKLSKSNFLPVIYSWTCFGANFAAKTSDTDLGLTSKMMFTDKKGGVAVISASGNSQFDQNFELYEKVLNNKEDNDETLGELFTKSKLDFYQKYINWDDNEGKKNLFQYLILGDPSLKLNYPQNENIISGDSVYVNYNSPFKIKNFPTDGEGILELYNSGVHRVLKKYITQSDLINGELSIILPDTSSCDTVNNPEHYLTSRVFWNKSDNTHLVDYLMFFPKNYSVGTKFLDIYTDPKQAVLDDTDSIGFCVEVINSIGIDSIVCHIDTVGTGNFNVELNDFAKDKYTYTSVNKLKNFKRNRDLNFYYTILDKQGNLTNSDTTALKIPIGDLYHYEYKPQYADSSLDSIQVKVALRFANPLFSTVKYDSIKTSFWLVDSKQEEFLGDTYLSLQVDNNKLVDSLFAKIKVDLTPGLHRYKADLNSNYKYDEYFSGIPPHENNVTYGYIKTTRYKVTVDNGSEINGIHSIVGDDLIKCEIPKNGVIVNSVLDIDSISITDYSISQSLIPAFQNSFDNPIGVKIKLFYNGSTLSKESNCIFKNISIENLDDTYSVYYFNPNIKKWQKIITEFNSKQIRKKILGRENNKSLIKKSKLEKEVKKSLVKNKAIYDVSFNFNKTGIFSIFKSNDNTIPQIAVNVEGVVFTDNSYISNKPKITIVAEDISGIDPSSIELFLDDTKVLDSQIQITDQNSVNNSVILSVTPSLSTGTHSLKVVAADNTGNIATVTKSMQVSSEFKVLYHGNYPNPFANETVFCYKLSGLARLVSLKIYTVSGRKIREFNQEDIVNYSEIRWDGRDYNGDLIANGVYFYKLVVKSGSKTIELKGKMAKIRK